MNSHTDTPRSPAKRWIIGAVAAVLVGLTAVTGATYANEGGMHHQRAMMDPAAMEKHVDAMVAKVLKDGTPQQKAKVAAICKAALTDLRPLHLQLREGHAQAVKLLTAASIDRAALEQLRVQQIAAVDAASKRILQAVEDAADVLTPEQRAKLAEHLNKHHGAIGHH